MILDTVAVSRLLEGDRRVGRLLTGQPVPGVPVIVVGEYRFGLMRSKLRAKLEPLFEQLIAGVELLAVDRATAEAYATVRHELRADGRIIPPNDTWIAALARQHGRAVVSQDAHFDWVKGLKRIGW